MSEDVARDPLTSAMHDLKLVHEWRAEYIGKYHKAFDEIARLTAERDDLWMRGASDRLLERQLREAREKIERLQKALRLVDEDVRGGGTARVTMGSDPNEFLTYAIKGSTIDVVRECLRSDGEEKK